MSVSRYREMKSRGSPSRMFEEQRETALHENLARARYIS
jgi:hypothetical protein